MRTLDSLYALVRLIDPSMSCERMSKFSLFVKKYANGICHGFFRPDIIITSRLIAVLSASSPFIVP